jgi:hypothetical protein
MPQYYLTHGNSTKPLTQEELDEALRPVSSWLKVFSVIIDPHDSISNTIDWHIIWDELIPDSDDFINTQLMPRYAVPLRKTDGIVSGVPTKYQRRIVQLAGLYIAYRIESRTYSGAQNPGNSEYAKALETQLNSLLNELLSDRVRLRGQRLKPVYRTVNPRFVPMSVGEQVRSTGEAGSGIDQYTPNTSGRP